MVVRPRLQFKSVKGDALGADRDISEVRPYVVVKSVPIHAEIPGRILQPDEPGQANSWSHLAGAFDHFGRENGLN